MDQQRFDTFTRSLTSAGNRRGILKLLGASLAGATPLALTASPISARPDSKNCPNLATGPSCGKNSRCVDGFCFHSAQTCLVNALVAGAKGKYKDAVSAIFNWDCGKAALNYLLKFVAQECGMRNPFLTCDTCKTFKAKGGFC